MTEEMIINWKADWKKALRVAKDLRWENSSFDDRKAWISAEWSRFTFAGVAVHAGNSERSSSVFETCAIIEIRRWRLPWRLYAAEKLSLLNSRKKRLLLDSFKANESNIKPSCEPLISPRYAKGLISFQNVFRLPQMIFKRCNADNFRETSSFQTSRSAPEGANETAPTRGVSPMTLKHTNTSCHVDLG